MAAAVVGATEVAAPPPTPPHHHLSLNTATLTGTPPPLLPNKYIPFCPTGPARHGLPSPPASPSDRSSLTFNRKAHYILHPPYPFAKAACSPDVYEITGETLARALAHAARQSLPDPRWVFPWLHGLHCENQLQLSFFAPRNRAARRTPRCLRGITIVKAGGDLSYSRLKGAIAPEELLSTVDRADGGLGFHDIDPKLGFSVRNFHIQACKLATVSDIVVYGDDETPIDDVLDLAQVISDAQQAYREETDPSARETEGYHTFIVTDSFSRILADHPEMVAIGPNGVLTGDVLDFSTQERVEMCNLSRASEICNNIYLGPTPGQLLFDGADPPDPNEYDILVETGDLSPLPSDELLNNIESAALQGETGTRCPPLEFPSSGSLDPICGTRPGSEEANRLVAFCRWMHRLANHGPADTRQTSKDPDGDSTMDDAETESNGTSARPMKFLLHCTDGYTETSLLALAYYVYAECVPLHEAWIRMHTDKQRNFFAYPADKVFLEGVESRLLRESPKAYERVQFPIEQPLWMTKMDGSLPSRVLPYLYLGNMHHADNHELLRALKIGRVLSVGEPIHWPAEQLAEWGEDAFLYIDNVQDNGVDPLGEEFDRCLDFIRRGREKGHATLVHCRVGVSRSATICIAEVMREQKKSFPQAYCFVRARRLNVIIQPHLRFSYELLRWEEEMQTRRGETLDRDLEWPTIAREIAAMNKPYCRQ